MRREANAPAVQLIREVFRVANRKWRGIGEIQSSGSALAPDFVEFDAERRFDVGAIAVAESSECVSGLIFKGSSSRAIVRPLAKRVPRNSAGGHDGLVRRRCVPPTTTMAGFVVRMSRAGSRRSRACSRAGRARGVQCPPLNRINVNGFACRAATDEPRPYTFGTRQRRANDRRAD